jgi:rhodanese-related sulfurtransferase
MRNLLLFGLFLSLAAWAGPKLWVSEQVYDFGEVKEGVLVVHTFLLKNVGDAVLTFTRAPGVSCGCTSAPLPKTTLEPGESVPLEVRFETTGYGGHRTIKYVYVYSDDPEAPQVNLALQGYVRPHEPFEETAYMLRYRYRLILDVRDREAFARGHLLGAVNVSYSQLEEAMDWLPNTVIYVCDEAGELGLRAAELLRRRGFWATRILAGGFAGWTREMGGYLVVGETSSASPQIALGAVSPSRLAQEYVIILDFRPAEEYEKEHLVGSLFVGPDGLEQILPYLLPAAALAPELQPFIFCVDEDETLASSAAQFLQNFGLARAYALVGGLPQWRIRYGKDFMVLGNP